MISLDKISAQKIRTDELLFSESHSRYLLAISPKHIKNTKSLLERHGVVHEIIGRFLGSSVVFKDGKKILISVRVDKAREKWLNSLESLVSHG